VSEVVKTTNDMPNNNRLQLIWAGLARNNRWSSYICQEDVNTFNRRMEGEGPEFYARGLHAYRAAFLTGLGKGVYTRSAGFGAKKDSVLPRFLYGAMRLIFSDDGHMLPIVNVDAVACVNQLTAVFTKIEGGHTPQSEENVISSFVKTEEEIASTSLDAAHVVRTWITDIPGGCAWRTSTDLGSVLDRAGRFIKRVLSGSDPREISPRHGSGVSACGTEVRDRYAAPRYVSRIDRIWPMHEYYYLSPTAFCDGLSEYLDMPELDDPCARVLLVPKDSRGPRLISCEPRETMWIQQGLMAELYSTIEAHYLTRGRVNFTRQGYNQLAAFVGSDVSLPDEHIDTNKVARYLRYEDNFAGTTWDPASQEDLALPDAHSCIRNAVFTDIASQRRQETIKYLHERGLHPDVNSDVAGKLATLDLKDASDRLRLDLVQRLFPSNWAEALTACRSAMTELPDGRLVSLSKHAPMGSAVCFPVMALTIWALLTAIAPKSARRQILVYGDDIVVPSFMTEDAIQVLESVGLRVNVQKSFSRGPFRESCGEEFIYGCRVTPIRLRMNPDDDNDSLMSLMAFNNNLLETPLVTDTGWFLELLQSWYGPKRVPIIMQPSRKRVSWLDYVQQLQVGESFRGVTLSGVALTDDPSRVNLPTGRGTRLHGRYETDPRKPRYLHRQYRLLVPRPRLVEYEPSGWSHVLRSLLTRSDRQSGVDTVHNCVRYVRQWVSLD